MVALTIEMNTEICFLHCDGYCWISSGSCENKVFILVSRALPIKISTSQSGFPF